MTTENQNSSGTTSALAQKTGIKPLAKIIAGVCAVVVALAAVCSIFGHPKGVSSLKDSVFAELDPTITFEEAVNRYCKENSGHGSNYFEDPKEFIEKANKGTASVDRAPFDTFETPCGKEEYMKRACVEGSFVTTRNAVWEDSGETSTGVRNMSVKFVDEGEVWIDARGLSLDERKKLATQAEFYLPPVDYAELFSFLDEKARSGDSDALKNTEKIVEIYSGHPFSALALVLGYSDYEKWISGTVEKLKEAEAGKLNGKEVAWEVSMSLATKARGLPGVELPSEEALAAMKAELDSVPAEVLTKQLKDLRTALEEGRKAFQESRPVIEEVCAYMDSLKKELQERKLSSVKYFKIKAKRDVFTIGFYVYPDGRVETKQTEELGAIYGKLVASGPDIEASAKPVVEQIFKTKRAKSVTCTEISGIKEVGDDEYVGIAHVKDNRTGRTSKHMVSMEILGDNIVVLVGEEL